MEPYLIYFFKASIGIFLFYLLYQLILRKETYYASNRIYLVIGLFLAVLLPLFPITYISPVALINNSEFFSIGSTSVQELPSSVTSIQEEESFWTIPYIISSIYVIGAIIFLLRLLIQTAFLFVKYQLGEKSQIDGITVINLKHKTMPFSFFKVVFINIQEYSKEESSNIIAHEKVHIQERHWVDLLIVELLTVLFWMNPIVWLYERSIKQNHEYLADQGVLLAGYNPGRYQALLINQLMGVNVIGLTNNLNYSLNKKRMDMMKKEKTSTFNKVKLLITLPVIAFLIFAFAKKEYTLTQQETKIISKEIKAKPEIILEKSVYISGKVVTLDGLAIKGAEFNYAGEKFNGASDHTGHFEFEIPANFNYYETEIDYGNNQKGRGMLMQVSRQGYAASAMLLDLKKEIKIPPILMRKNITVTGRVINNLDKPMDGVNIIQKGTSKGTVTNSNGEFSIESAQKHILVFSYIGYKTIDLGLVDPKNDDVEIVMKKSVYNIELPEITEEEIVNMPPPPPPAKADSDKDDVWTIVEDMPYYKKGGMNKLSWDILQETEAIMKETKDRGEAVVKFIVKTDGKVYNAHVIKSAKSEMLDALALNIVRKLEWNPGIQRGKPVDVDLTVPIKF